MKLLLFLFIALTGSTGWQTDFSKAQNEAIQNHKLILLNFSGSDWCIPCMRLKKDIFDTREFTEYAEENLVLVNADFPRQKKNKPGKEVEDQNNTLAEKYDPKGLFPHTLLLSADGRILTQWEGNPDLKANEFIRQIKLACTGAR